MKKILTSPRSNRCIGCGLCVIRASLLIGNTVDLSKSFITITGSKGNYKVLIDYGRDVDINNLEDIVKICPKNCFDIKEEENYEE